MHGTLTRSLLVFAGLGARSKEGARAQAPAEGGNPPAEGGDPAAEGQAMMITIGDANRFEVGHSPVSLVVA